MTNLRFSVIAGALTALLVSGANASAAPLRGAVSDVPHIAARDLGRAPSSGPMSIAITLAYRNAAQLDDLVEHQSDPSSPLFRHFLTPDQFARVFGPTPTVYARVIGSLQRAGLRVTQTYPNRTVVDAAGSVADVERYFGTQIHRVIQPGASDVRLANTLPAHEPVDLTGLIENVDGLNTLTFLHTDIARASHFAPGVGPDKAGPPLKGPVGGFGPLAFSQGYDLPEQHLVAGSKTKYYDGTGRKSGVVIDADFLDSDLAAFLKYFNVKRTGPATVRVPIDGGPPPGLGSPDSVETELDVSTIVSNAPGTALYVYEFPNFNKNSYITDAYNMVVSDDKVDTANSSFGGCETAQPRAAKAWDKIAEQGAALGITFHASTGDGGSTGYGCSGPSVNAPASGTHFVAVGGTALSVDANGNYVSETGWNGSGGGVSSVFALPAWQKGVKNVITTGRNLPDVSFDADPFTGTAFYYNGTWNNPYDPLGGTSLSSPIFGAAQTEIDQVEGGRYGLAGKQIFTFFKSKGYASFFHDVTSGSNGKYAAGTGYDNVTGIGSMDAYTFANAI